MLQSTRFKINYPQSDRSDSSDVPRDFIAAVTGFDGLAMMYGQGTLAARPVSTGGSPGIQGRIYCATDQSPHQFFYDFGTGWDQIGASPTIGSGISITQLAMMMYVEGVLRGISGDPQTALQVSAGSGWQMSIATGFAFVQGDDTSDQGLYPCEFTTTTTITLGTQVPVGQNRVDAIGLQFNDVLFTGRTPAGANLTQVAGTETAGATLANLNGAPGHSGGPAFPPSFLLLAWYEAHVGDSGVVGARIGDARKVAGPAIWGEDSHRYRLAVNNIGAFSMEQVV